MTAVLLVHDLLDGAAARNPDAPAVRRGSDVLTYAGVRERSARLSAWLRSCGVGRGDRVVVALPADVLVPPLLYACARAGAVFVVTYHDSPEAVADHLLGDAAPALAVAADGPLRTAAGRRGIPVRGLDDLRAASAPGVSAPDAPPPAAAGPIGVDPVCFVYTSGSTAMPKAVVSTHLQVTFATRAIASQVAMHPGDAVYCTLPLAFDFGLYQVFLCTLAGAELVLAGPDGAGHRLVVGLRETGATVLPAVPTLAGDLARLLARRPASLERLRLLTSTGAAMPPAVLADLRRRLPNLRVQLMYGLTECKRATIMPLDGDLDRPGSCGRALPGTEVFVADAAGRRLGAGEVGEIVVRGPNVMAGYWRAPDLTAERFRRAGGLFPELRTGDHGWLDGGGYLYFAGRRDDVYKERGTRVSAIEVEAAAHRVPGVRAAVVMPPPDGEPGAVLLVESDLAAADVLGGLSRQIDAAKVPRRCVVVASLPRGPNGKVERRALAGLVREPSDG